MKKILNELEILSSKVVSETGRSLADMLQHGLLWYLFRTYKRAILGIACVVLIAMGITIRQVIHLLQHTELQGLI